MPDSNLKLDLVYNPSALSYRLNSAMEKDFKKALRLDTFIFIIYLLSLIYLLAAF